MKEIIDEKVENTKEKYCKTSINKYQKNNKKNEPTLIFES